MALPVCKLSTLMAFNASENGKLYKNNDDEE